MGVLREKRVWRRVVHKGLRGFRLTAEEKANVRTAIRAATRGYGRVPKLAEAMGVNRKFIDEAVGYRARISVGLALAFARATGVLLENLLAGVGVRRCPACRRAL